MRLTVSIIVLRILLGFDLCSFAYTEESYPRATTPLGPVEGYYKTSSNGRKYAAYEGIPYAEPPIGELRFEAPKTISPWKDVLIAKQPSSSCIQYNPVLPNATVAGSEDCLSVNVYAAIQNSSKDKINGPSSRLLPVIFFIHPGAFRWGSGSDFGPKFLLDEDVVVVTFNYRLGPLGFLSTEDCTVPGNNGLKDQVTALKWVKHNIKSFGGDPSRITIFGCSAGAGSVNYLYLTPLTNGLFQGGMSLSGTVLDSWAQTENSLEKAKKLATILGCPSDSNRRMVNCLKNRPASQIVLGLLQFTPWSINPAVPFGLVVEKKCGNFSFINRSPAEIIRSGDAHNVPWITSVTSEEGVVLTALFIANKTLFKELNDNWETIAPLLLDYNYTIPKSDQAEVARLIRKHYLGTRPIDLSTFKEVTDMASDRTIKYGAAKSAKLQARANESPVRFYCFSYRGAHSVSEFITGTTTNYGVAHEDDLAYVFDMGLDTTSTPKDRAMQKKFIKLWVSYAATGTPDVGVDWQPVKRNSKEFNYLRIAGPDELYMESSDDFGQIDFWESIGFHENQ